MFKIDLDIFGPRFPNPDLRIRPRGRFFFVEPEFEVRNVGFLRPGAKNLEKLVKCFLLDLFFTLEL